MKRKRTLWETVGRANFAIFYNLIKFFSLSLSRRFLYVGLSDKSIYEDQFENPILNVHIWDKVLPSPLGIAAGFDTTFKYNDELIQYGFGFEEFGTFTQKPWRDSTQVKFISAEKNIIVSQHVFANKGIDFAQKQLVERRHLPQVAGISLALNSQQLEEKEENSFFINIQHALEQMTRQVAPYCDYIVINLSHPHLPFSNLLTNVSILEETIVKLQDTIKKAAPITRTKLLIKLPLNLNKTHIDLLADTFIRTHLDGVIIGGYMSAASFSKQQTGKNSHGYVCGQVLKPISNKIIADFYQSSKGQIPIIACGGIFSGEDAFEKISLGATLVQIHSAILYKGPSVGNKISKKLAFLLRKNGFRNIQEAVGSANKIHEQIISNV